MPVSLDNIDKLSCDELKDNLISMYEDKLKNSLIIDDELLSIILRRTKGIKGRYVDICISSFKNVNGITGCGMLFDLKYKVPIIQITKPFHVTSYTMDLACKWEDEGRTFSIPLHRNHSIISLICITKREMFSEVHINDKYSDKYSEGLKTYKRFIELKGEKL